MSEYFDYIELESGIHHFIWLDNSNESTSAYRDFLIELFGDLPDDTVTVVRIFLDYRQVPFHPFLQVVDNSKLLSTTYPHIIGRVAYLIRDLSVEIFMECIAQASQNENKRRLFKPNEEQEAIDWLLSDE